ncbi:hypothetical protein EC988_005057 [Linderina pennispora]|nr:hypothetical protein EC988_005057 [Linderina pennispora]
MSGGTSMHNTEAAYTHNISKHGDTQDTASLSAMATPRNTFLYPPTGLSISARASIQSTSTASPNTTWDSLQHQRQLQRLLEEKGMPGGSERMAVRRQAFDDTYSLLGRGGGPATRAAAQQELRQLSRSSAGVPQALLAPVSGLAELEAALAGIVERRQVSRREADQHSIVSQASGEAGRTPYGDLNEHLDQLTAAITRLQAPGRLGHERRRSAESGRSVESAEEVARGRASSRASLLSGTSAESRRRILVTEVPESSQFQGLFGSAPYAERDLPRKPSSVALSTVTSSTGGSQSALKRVTKPTALLSEWDGTLARPVTSSGPTVTVRAITPASRQALWLNVYIAGDAARRSLFKRRQWHRRFAIFAGNVLYLFKSSAPAATALQHVRLSPGSIVCVSDAFPAHKWVVELTQPREARLSLSNDEAQSWFLETEQRTEMVGLLKSLKGAVKDLQAQPDAQRREEERLMTRRRKQRKEAKQNADVCPWEADEFSDNGSAGSDSEQEEEEEKEKPVEMVSQMLDGYSMEPRFTGTGGIAEWGALRMHMPYEPAPVRIAHRAYSTDPSGGRRPSLADALAPPPSATLETTPGARRISTAPSVDASQLIEQMFASASRELATPATPLFAVREEEESFH